MSTDEEDVVTGVKPREYYHRVGTGRSIVVSEFNRCPGCGSTLQDVKVRPDNESLIECPDCGCVNRFVNYETGQNSG